MIEQCPVLIKQTEEEFRELLKAFCELKPKNVLEIGSLCGGTLWFWMHNLEKDSRVTLVDELIATSAPEYKAQKEGHDLLWHSWAENADVLLRIITGDSKMQSNIELVKESAPFDFLFIDGGHDYETVKSDYESYSPLVRKGGIIALHDIAATGGGYGVLRLWNEISPLYERKTRIVHTEGTRGIGILYK